MLLLAVQIQGNLIQIEMLEIEWIALRMTVECLIGHESNHETRGQLPGKQFLVTHVQVMLRNHKRLAHHTSNWIFCSTPFHRLGVSKENGRHDFNFLREKRSIYIYSI